VSSVSTINNNMARLIPLSQVEKNEAGGKARGLRNLIDSGARVPGGYAITGGSIDDVARLLENFSDDELDTLWAVRSSAMDEDGESASFAGQFETILDVRGRNAILQAVEQCRNSASSERVASYSREMNPEAEGAMAVVLQQMITPLFAGVIFTADPVKGRRDHLVINAVRGVGEKLVSGEATGDQYTFSLSGKKVSTETERETPLLTDKFLQRLFTEAKAIEEAAGFPSDLEWAIDSKGVIYWLQLRPITTLPAVHLNELDSSIQNIDNNYIITRSNIGEMMPGPVTPLTWSIFGRAIDYGLQDFYVQVGARKKITSDNFVVHMYYNHLFMSLTALYELTGKVLMTKKENIDHSILGHILDGSEAPPSAGTLRRTINLAKYIRYISKASKRLKKLKVLADNFTIDEPDDIKKFYENILKSIDVINQAWSWHYTTSGKSGALNTSILQILNGGSPEASIEHHRTLAGLLVNIEGIDGADALAALDRLAVALLENPESRAILAEKEIPEILSWLESDIPGEGHRLYRDFMIAHGHRCVREAELREKNWAAEPSSLIRLLKNRARSYGGEKKKSMGGSSSFDANLNSTLETLKLSGRMALKKLLPGARASVANRENSKSLCIAMQNKIRHACIHLGEKLTEERLLDDSDQIFFLTHKEIGELVADRNPGWKEKAAARRVLFPRAEELSFEDVYFGKPEPLENIEAPVMEAGSITGIPVSAGTITGPVRIINSIDDAGELLPGEIMVASYTDVGWTPYFSIAAGLITEIGSSLSHGAVVAREYGIPAVVNVKGAKRALATGDVITLNGETGIIEKKV